MRTSTMGGGGGGGGRVMMVAFKCSDYLLVKIEMTGKLARNGETTKGRVLKQVSCRVRRSLRNES